MIRIETTAEFDAEGRFIARGQVLRPVTPGSHRVTIVLAESESTSTDETTVIEDTDDPLLKRINGVLVWTGQILETPDETRKRLDEEQTERILNGPFE